MMLVCFVDLHYFRVRISLTCNFLVECRLMSNDLGLALGVLMVDVV